MKRLLYLLLLFLFANLAAQQSQYAFVKKVIDQKGRKTVRVNYVQYLTGDAAVKAAKLNGDAEVSYNKEGKAEYYVLDDYYLLDEKKIRNLSLSKNCVFRMQVIKNGLPKSSVQTFLYFKTHFKEKLFKLKLNKTGEVSLIEEQYLP